MPFAMVSERCQKGPRQNLPYLISFMFYLQIATLLESRRGDSNPWPAHYECAVSGCWALQGFANPAYLKPFSFLCLALCCTVLRSRWSQSDVNVILVLMAFVGCG